METELIDNTNYWIVLRLLGSLNYLCFIFFLTFLNENRTGKKKPVGYWMGWGSEHIKLDGNVYKEVQHRLGLI